jgi:glyoxylase-like metal-dependent hydrolase (beta-lactamase superfamily II)
MKLDGAIHYTHVDLMPGVPLYVYAIKGERYSVLIDTGIKQMHEQVLELCQEVGNVKYVLITHAHADHIGCNVAVREATGAHFAAAGALPWIEDLETHYQEFCIPSEHLPDSPEQRAEIMNLMDGAVHVDVVSSEGTRFRLGNVELTALALPGHKLEEVAFLDNAGNLFMGDVLLALAAPFFHGFQTAQGFRHSLERLETLMKAGQIKRVLAAHHPPLNTKEALKSINDTKNFLDEVEATTLIAATGVDFPTLWKDVCKRMNKQLEFRGFAMLQVQVEELIQAGKLRRDGERIIKV